MATHNVSKDVIIENLSTDASNGLSSKEAAARLEKYGANRLREKKKKTMLIN